MSISPFMTPGQSRERRERAASRRRRRRLLGAVLLCALIAAAAVLVSGVLGGSSAGGGASTAERTTRKAAPSAAPRLSAYGLPLAAPALALGGLSSPSQDPLHLAFRHPPRAAMLINLETGEVLWQRNALLHVPIASLTKMMTALLAVKATTPRQTVLITKAAIETSGCGTWKDLEAILPYTDWIFYDIKIKRLNGFEMPDASAQFARDGERDETGLLFFEFIRRQFVFAYF